MIEQVGQYYRPRWTVNGLLVVSGERRGWSNARGLLAHALVLSHGKLPIHARDRNGFRRAIGPFDLDLVNGSRGAQAEMQSWIIL